VAQKLPVPGLIITSGSVKMSGNAGCADYVTPRLE